MDEDAVVPGLAGNPVSEHVRPHPLGQCMCVAVSGIPDAPAIGLPPPRKRRVAEAARSQGMHGGRRPIAAVTTATHIRILAALATAAVCSSALAEDSFRVSVLVQSERRPVVAPADFPTAPHLRPMAPAGQTQRFVYAGDVEAAKRFYEAELRKHGYRLVRADAGSAVWERGNIMARLEFNPVVGTRDGTTLVRLTATAREPAAAPSG